MTTKVDQQTFQYRSMFLSDIHLGTNSCKAEYVNNFLKTNQAKHLFLVGDIIDGWKIQQNKWRWRQSHSNVVRRILKQAKDGTEVIYITGNHDEFLRPMVNYQLNFGRVRIMNHAEHRGLDGNRYLVVHGDMFDGITRLHKWLALLGDQAYEFVLWLNTGFNWWRHRLGFGYWSLSKFLKHRVKKAVDFIFEFEKNITDYCRRKGYDGVICGHIHHAEIKIIDGIVYMNDGDWQESCTALVEHWDGRWEIIQWTEASADLKTTNTIDSK